MDVYGEEEEEEQEDTSPPRIKYGKSRAPHPPSSSGGSMRRLGTTYYEDDGGEMNNITPGGGGRKHQQQQLTATTSTFIPPKLNWLNVPDSVQDTFCALDLAIVHLHKHNKRLQQHNSLLEKKYLELEEYAMQLEDAILDARERNERFQRDVLKQLESLKQAQQSIQQVDENQIVSRAVEEVKRTYSIRPEEIRQTLKKIEATAAKQPGNLNRRLEQLEQYRHNSMQRTSSAEHLKRMQRARLEEAISSLRKLAV